LAFPARSQKSFLCVLRALCANPVFQDLYKSVSRRREKKWRLRRDAALANAPSEKTKRCQTKVWRSQRVHKNLFSVFSVPSVRTLFFKTCTKAYRAVARRSGAYAAMQRLRTLPVKRQNDAKLKFGVPSAFTKIFSLCSPCPLCEPCFSRLVQKRIAPSREEGALTPRCLSSLCSLCANPVFLLRHANLKVGVPRRSRDVHKRIAPSRKEGALTPRCCACERSQGVPRAFSGHSQAYRAVARRSGAYAAMLRSGTLPRRSQTFPVNTPGRPVI